MKKSKILLGLLLVIFSFTLPETSYAQSPTFSWVQTAGGTGADRGANLAISHDGTLVVVGGFADVATFGARNRLTSAGNTDVFVAKYDNDGSLLWVQQAGGPGADAARSVAIAPDGAVVVTGTYSGTATFSPDVSLSSAGGPDIFLAKYDAQGRLLWARSAGGPGGRDFAFKVAVDTQGNIYVAGLFDATATFAPGVSFTSAGDSDLFLAKYDSSGTLLWVKAAGGPGHEEAVGVSIGPDGNVYVAGIFAETVTFGPGVTLTSAGQWDLFFAKYDPAGNLLLLKGAGGPDFDEGYTALADRAGNIIVTGNFAGTAKFAPDVELTSAGSADTYLAKFDATGTLLWVRQVGGPAFDQIREIALDAAGNIYAGGRFQSTTTLAPGVTLTSAGSNDVFVAKFNPSGTLLWAVQAGGTGDDRGLDIAVDSRSNAYVTGLFSGSATFGSFTRDSAGGTDMFVAKLIVPTILATGQRLTSDGARQNFIYAIDVISGNASPLSPPIAAPPPGLAGTPDGRLLAVSNNQLGHLDPRTGQFTAIGAPLGVEATNLDVLTDGRVFIVPFRGSRQLHRVEPTGEAIPVGAPTSIGQAIDAAAGLPAGTSQPFIIGLGSVGQTIYGVSLETNRTCLVAIDPDTGAARVVGGPNAVSAANDGRYSGFAALTGVDENGDGQFDGLYGSVNFFDDDANPNTPVVRFGGVARFDLSNGTWSIVGSNPGVIFFGFGAMPEPAPGSRTATGQFADFD